MFPGRQQTRQTLAESHRPVTTGRAAIGTAAHPRLCQVQNSLCDLVEQVSRLKQQAHAQNRHTATSGRFFSRPAAGSFFRSECQLLAATGLTCIGFRPAMESTVLLAEGETNS